MPILSQLKTKKFPSASDIMTAISDTTSDTFNLKLGSKLIGASLVQKQLNPSGVDLQPLHKKLS